MDGFKAYKYYIAIKLHFTKDNFDVFKNRGNVKGTRDAFNARNDRYMFEKLARKYPVDRDLIQFYVANFAYGNDAAVYSFEEAETKEERMAVIERNLSKHLVGVHHHMSTHRCV